MPSATSVISLDVASREPVQAMTLPSSDGRYVVRGEEVITFPQICKELGWSFARLTGMQMNCPYLDEGVLAFRWDRLPTLFRLPKRTVARGKDVRHITVAKYEELKRKVQ